MFFHVFGITELNLVDKHKGGSTYHMLVATMQTIELNFLGFFTWVQ